MPGKWATAGPGLGLARGRHHIVVSRQRHCTADHRHHASAAERPPEAAAGKRCALLRSPAHARVINHVLLCRWEALQKSLALPCCSLQGML